MAAAHPPPPVCKPGRVRVIQALQPSTFINRERTEEISVAEGDVLYITEAAGNAEYYNVKCNNKIGLIPRNYVNNEDCTAAIEYPLQNAAKRGNLQFLLDCLEHNVSVNVLDRSGSTALYWAAHSGHAAIVQVLLEKPNISISFQNKLGDTPLHGAAYKNRLDCVKLLVEAGADPHIRNKAFKKPIDMTTSVEIASILRITMSNRIDESVDDDYNDSSSDERN